MNTNILFLEHCIDNTVGGSHYCLLEICRQFRHSSFNCIVVFYQENDLVEEFRDAGATVLLMPPPGQTIREKTKGRSLFFRIIISVLLRFEMLLVRPFKWASLMRRNNVDILHLNNNFSDDIDVVIAARFLGKKVVAHVRGLQRAVSSSALWFGNRMDAIVVISQAVQERVGQLGITSNNVHLVFDGIAPDRLTSQSTKIDIRTKHGIPDDGIIIGMVGNVKVWKGQEVLVRAFCQIAAERDDVYCIVVGAIADREYHERVVQIASDNGVSERVIFTGYQKRVGDYLKRFDIFVHCSIDPEPFGIVILEAMSLKKPVIATSIGAPKEIVVDGESGILFDPSDATELVVAISALLSNKSLANRIRENGHLRFKNHFTSEINANRLREIYDGLGG